MIVIYRKDAVGAKPKRLTKAQADKLAQRLELVARVKRPELVEFFTSGDFYKLPAVSPKCIDNRPHRIMEHANDCWPIPDSCLGRVADKVASGDKVAVKSATQSILLWIKQNLADVVNPDHVSVVDQ